MTLDISHERTLIHRQVTLIEGVGFCMPQLLASRRELGQIQVLLKLIIKHLHELEHLEKNVPEVASPAKIDSYSQANTRIKNHMIRKGAQIRQLMREEDLRPYACVALKSLYSIL
jgi:hypothetical protein